MENKEIIESGNAVLGIEFGSTRIKAVLINDKYEPIANGSFTWENSLENGIWTYPLEQIHEGLQTCYADLKKDVQEKYGIKLTKFKSAGVSAMMHGYLAFDKDGNLTEYSKTADLTEINVYPITYDGTNYKILDDKKTIKVLRNQPIKTSKQSKPNTTKSRTPKITRNFSFSDIDTYRNVKPIINKRAIVNTPKAHKLHLLNCLSHEFCDCDLSKQILIIQQIGAKHKNKYKL